MRYHVTVLPERRIGFARLAGAVDGEVLCKALDALYAHPSWQPGFASLWDGSGIRALAVRPEGAERLVARLVELMTRAEPGRTALVLRRELDVAFARMICARTKCLSQPRKIFRSLPRALGWVVQESVGRTAAGRRRLLQAPPTRPAAPGLLERGRAQADVRAPR